MSSPHYHQETDYTCGPAALRMVAASCGIKKSEKFFARLLKTNARIGTKNRAFATASKKLGFMYNVKENTRVSHLKKLLKSGYRVIVCYYHPKERVGHYAVVAKITKTRMYLLDPFSGPRHTYTLRVFSKIWRGEYELSRHWCIAIRNE